MNCALILEKYLRECKDLNKTACVAFLYAKNVQVGKAQEKAQSEKDSHSKNQGGKKPN